MFWKCIKNKMKESFTWGRYRYLKTENPMYKRTHICEKLCMRHTPSKLEGPSMNSLQEISTKY